MCPSAFKKLFSAHPIGVGPTLIRLVVGLIFIAHGAQKLFGWFEGGGLAGTARMMSSLGLTPEYFLAITCAVGEFLGGILLLVGLATRVAGFVLTINMLVAMFLVHFQHGFFISDGGYEYALLLLVCAFAYLLSGGGCFSFDRILSKRCTHSSTHHHA